MRPELIAACQMFLAPTTVLFAALGLARTEGLKAGISAIGLAIAVVWFALAFWWPGLTYLEKGAAMALSALSGGVWFISAVVHIATTTGYQARLPNIMRPV